MHAKTTTMAGVQCTRERLAEGSMATGECEKKARIISNNKSMSF